MKRSTGALLVVVAAAVPRLAACSCASATTILDEFVDKSDRVRDDARRPRDVRIPPGSAVGVHAAALRLVPRGSLPPVRPLVARRRDRAGRRRRRDGARRVRDRLAAAIDRRRTRRRAASRRSIRTSIWHDVHLNREVLDGLVLAVLALCALAAYERRSLPLSALTGARRGLRDPRQRAARASAARDRRLRRVADRSGLADGDRRRARRRDGRARRRAVGRAERGRGSAATRSRPIRERSGRRTTRTRATCSTTEAGSTTCPSSRARRHGRSLPPDLTLAGTPTVEWTSARRCGSTARRSSSSGARSPARRRLLALQATRMLWSPVPQRVGRERKRSGAACAQDDRARVRDRPLRRSRSPASSSRPRTSSGSLRSCSRTTRSLRWCSQAPRATGRRGTSSSRSSRRSRSRPRGSVSAFGGAAYAGGASARW